MLKQTESYQLAIDDVLRVTHARHLANREGALADYIPELAAANPDHFGIAVATVDGRVHEIGDTNQPFTIQSVSKAFVYCLALELVGRDAPYWRASELSQAATHLTLSCSIRAPIFHLTRW